jgi:hypothetical protein
MLHSKKNVLSVMILVLLSNTYALSSGGHVEREGINPVPKGIAIGAACSLACMAIASGLSTQAVYGVKPAPIMIGLGNLSGTALAFGIADGTIKDSEKKQAAHGILLGAACMGILSGIHYGNLFTCVCGTTGALIATAVFGR